MAPVLRRSVRTCAGTHGRLAPLHHPDMGIPLPIRGQPSVSSAGAPALPPAVGGHSPVPAWPRQLSTSPVRFWQSLTTLVNPAHTAVPVLHCTSTLGLAVGLGPLCPCRRLTANAPPTRSYAWRRQAWTYPRCTPLARPWTRCPFPTVWPLLCSASISTTATSFAGSAASTQALIGTGMPRSLGLGCYI